MLPINSSLRGRPYRGFFFVGSSAFWPFLWLSFDSVKAGQFVPTNSPRSPLVGVGLLGLVCRCDVGDSQPRSSFCAHAPHCILFESPLCRTFRCCFFVAAADAGSCPDHHTHFVEVHRVQEGQGGGVSEAVAGGRGRDQARDAHGEENKVVTHPTRSRCPQKLKPRIEVLIANIQV